MVLICKHCHKEFIKGNQPHQIYCSRYCLQEFNYIRKFGPRIKHGLSNGTVGAMAELAVSMDLMKKGFEVYRALSPSSSCDVFAFKNNISYPIEIRTGYYNSNKSGVRYPGTNIRAKYIAVYTFVDNKVHYIIDPHLFN